MVIELCGPLEAWRGAAVHMELEAKRRRVCLTIEKKVEILEYTEKNPTASQGHVGILFGIGQFSVSTIMKNKAAILELAAT